MMQFYEKVLSGYVEKGFKFVLYLDNYFTYPRTLHALGQKGVAVVGTARPKRSWPPKELNVPSNAVFNDLYYCVDDNGLLVMRWIDNNVVLLVSTAHRPHGSIE